MIQTKENIIDKILVSESATYRWESSVREVIQTLDEKYFENESIPEEEAYLIDQDTVQISIKLKKPLPDINMTLKKKNNDWIWIT